MSELKYLAFLFMGIGIGMLDRGIALLPFFFGLLFYMASEYNKETRFHNQLSERRIIRKKNGKGIIENKH